MKAILPCLLALLLCACATTNSSKTPAKEIPVYQSTNAPTQSYTIIKKLDDDGAEKEEEEIIAQFIQKARKLGGDAIILEPKKPSGMEAEIFGFGKINYTFLYQANVIRFQ